MPNRPIPVNYAHEMIGTYLNYMTGLGVDMTKQTHSVSFVSADLLKWMAEVQPYTDEFRICEGVYPAGHPSAGRMTVIIWPYKNGVPATIPGGEGQEGNDGGATTINPFNEGTGRP